MQDQARGGLDARLVAELPHLRAFLRRLAGGSARGRADAEDLAQEVVARALRSRHSFEAERALRPWLFTTAVRTFLDWRERAAREPSTPHLSPDTELHEPVDGRPAVGQDLAEREQLEHLLSRLTPVERELLVAFHRRGLSVRELAAAHGLPEGTVKSHLHRARRKLASIDPEHLGGPS